MLPIFDDHDNTFDVLNFSQALRQAGGIGLAAILSQTGV